MKTPKLLLFLCAEKNDGSSDPSFFHDAVSVYVSVSPLLRNEPGVWP